MITICCPHTLVRRGARTLACRIHTRVNACLFFALLQLPLSAQTVHIGVFTLFRPTEFRITASAAPILITSEEHPRILHARQSLTIRASQIAAPIRVTAADGSAATFVLAIPGKIDRRFHGTLTIQPSGGHLAAIITMDRETAVASVVAAEMPPGAALEALKAQAVAARSYYAAAGPRHNLYDFCDTTHCQFLRAPPDPKSLAAHAAEGTRGLVLEYEGKPLAALYSASCGGRTKTLEGDPSGYPYFAVPCDYCRRHSPGIIRGHQLGLCQLGAAGMAADGSTFQAILDHYFPGVSIKQFPLSAIFLLPPSPPLSHSRN